MLDDRDLRILRAVVEAFVQDGRPVSSQRVKETADLVVSTATIRSSMARLENGGFLAKPHTSAGRVPTDDGYRAYVDNLETRARVRDTFSSRLRNKLRDQELDTSKIMACASRVLGGLSKNLAVVYGAVIQESRVSCVQLVSLEGTRLLVVVNLSPEYERTVVLRMGRQFTHDVIERSQVWINRLVANKSLVEAKEALDNAVRDNVTDEGIVAREVAVHREEIFSGPPAVELYFEERNQLPGRAEPADLRLLRLLLRLLHNREYIARILSDRSSEQTRITIGHEHSDRALRPFSLVTSGYRLGGSSGVLGIIGPTRMRYDLNMSLVGAAARELRAIGEEYF
ncbi:MAG: heat-inducible transcriptional repressor HrcA [Candidatus Krumholzibacteriia bacterium]